MHRSIIVASYVAGILVAFALNAVPAVAADDSAYARFGVLVSADGHILAPLSAVDGCTSVASPTLGPLRVLHVDADFDLALLQAQGGARAYVALGDASAVEPRALLIAALPASGDPQTPGLVQASGRMVAASTSMRNALFMSIEIAEPHVRNAALVLDRFGGVFAVVVGDFKRETMVHSDWTLWSPLPKNKALKRDAVGTAMLRDFLESQDVAYASTAANAPLSEQAAIKRLADAVTPIACRR